MMRQLYRRIVATTSFVIAVVLAPAPAVSLAQTPPVRQQKATPSTDDAALQAFRKAIDDYLALHRRLHEEVPGHKPNSDAREVNAAADVLAAAIQRARPKARQGDFFSAAPTGVIKRRVVDTVRTERLNTVLAGADDEPPTITTPRIYMRFPASSQMASMPPSLLEVLPPLPSELEYRIVGSYLVLRDTHAAIILDYIAQAVPRK